MLERIVNFSKEAKQAVRDGSVALTYPMLNAAEQSNVVKGFFALLGTNMAFSAVLIAYSVNSWKNGVADGAWMLGAGVACADLAVFAGSYYVVKSVLSRGKFEDMAPEVLNHPRLLKVAEVYARRNGRLEEYQSALEGLAASG